MEAGKKKGYAWAVSAGVCAASAAISAKLIGPQLKNLSALQATATNFATNFLTYGLSGYFLFPEPVSEKWFAGALLIGVGALILSKLSIEKKARTD